MTRIAEYGTFPAEDIAARTLIEERTTDKGAFSRTYRLWQVGAGWETAGSVARWTDGYWAVLFDMDGASHGRRFRDEQEARCLFDAWTQ